MKLPKGYLFPDFLNLAKAPPAPQGGMAFAPSVHLVPGFTINNVISGQTSGRSPQALGSYLMPFGQLTPGDPFLTAITNALTPNPYSPQ